MQLQAAGLVVVLVLLVLHKLLPAAALFPLTAPQHPPLVAPLMQQEAQALLQLFSLLVHIWLLLAAVVVVQVLQAMVALAVLALIMARVAAGAVQETALAASSAALAEQARPAL